MQEIYKGALPNDKTGTPARPAAQIINDNFAYLDAKITRKDSIVVSTGFAISGQDVTYNAYWQWIIDTIDYTNPVDVVLNFPYATTGKSRLDMVALTTSNTFIRIPGIESDSNPVSEPLPDNMLLVGFVLVTDSSVGDPSSPIIGDPFVKKLESQDVIVNYGATTVIEQINLTDDRSSISLTGSVTDVKSVQVSGEFIRMGKPHFFKNRTGHDVKIWHLAGAGNIKYFFPNGLDLIVKPNEVIEFNTNANDSAYVRFERVGINDDIYQPDVLISSVPPTRVINTFTYPANGYTALILKTVRTNPAEFETTIGVATDDYKRVDLIYFKSDNTIEKIIGDESLTVAIRPDIPTNAVGISFINVFGSVIETPTPITKEISVQDSLGVEKFKISDYVRFKGAKFDSSKKQIEISPLTANAIYLASTGSDVDYEPENKEKPFLTLNACTSWLDSQSHKGLNWYIIILDNGTYAQTNAFSLQGFNIINNNGGTIKIQNNFAISKQWIFNFANGNLVFETISTSTLVLNTYKSTNTEYIDHFINNVTFNDTLGIFNGIDRGWFRIFGGSGNFTWGNVINNSQTCFGNQINSSLSVMNFGTVTNNATGVAGIDFFSTVSAENTHSCSLFVNSYINTTTSTHVLTIKNKGKIGSITSTLGNTILACNELVLDQNVSYNNVLLLGLNTPVAGSNGLIVPSPKIIGNGFFITFNNTIGSYLIYQSLSIVRTSANYQTSFILFQNVNMVISSGSSITHILPTDLRNDGRFGTQLILDNFVLICNTAGIKLANFMNQAGVTAPAVYQIIFRNSVRIMNNTYLIQSDANSVQPSNLLVKENASIFHDFGIVSANANINSLIPSNDNYSELALKLDNTMSTAIYSGDINLGKLNGINYGSFSAVNNNVVTFSDEVDGGFAEIKMLGDGTHTPVLTNFENYNSNIVFNNASGNENGIAFFRLLGKSFYNIIYGGMSAVIAPIVKSLYITDADNNVTVNSANYPFTTSTPFTIRFKVKRTSDSVYSGIFALANATLPMFEIISNNSNQGLYLSFGGSTLAKQKIYGQSTGPLTLDVWEDICITYDGAFGSSSVNMYVGNVSKPIIVALNTYDSSPTGMTKCVMGHTYYASEQSENLKVANLVVINKVLNSTERTEAYNGGVSFNFSTASFLANIISWHKFDDNLLDSRGFNNGTAAIANFTTDSPT